MVSFVLLLLHIKDHESLESTLRLLFKRCFTCGKTKITYLARNLVFLLIFHTNIDIKNE